MGILRAFQSALDGFFSKYSLLIFQFGLSCFLLLPALIFWGLIGTGCVILGIIAVPVFILFSPVLVPVGIVVGGVTSVTLAAVGIVVWRWKTIVRIGERIVKAAKGMHLKFAQWLLAELAKMDATSTTEQITVPATSPRLHIPQDSTGTPSEDDTTPSENSPEKSEQMKADSSSSQKPEQSSSEHGPTDDSLHSAESSAGADAKEKSLLLKSFLCICAGIALVQFALLVFFSFLAKNLKTYTSSVLEMASK